MCFEPLRTPPCSSQWGCSTSPSCGSHCHRAHIQACVGDARCTTTIHEGCRVGHKSPKHPWWASCPAPTTSSHLSCWWYHGYPHRAWCHRQHNGSHHKQQPCLGRRRKCQGNPEKAFPSSCGKSDVAHLCACWHHTTLSLARHTGRRPWPASSWGAVAVAWLERSRKRGQRREQARLNWSGTRNLHIRDLQKDPNRTSQNLYQSSLHWLMADQQCVQSLGRTSFYTGLKWRYICCQLQFHPHRTVSEQSRPWWFKMFLPQYEGLKSSYPGWYLQSSSKITMLYQSRPRY